MILCISQLARGSGYHTTGIGTVPGPQKALTEDIHKKQSLLSDYKLANLLIPSTLMVVTLS